jgi:hypothetical protein
MISPLLVTFFDIFFVMHRSQAVLVMMELPSRLKGKQAEGKAGSRRSRLKGKQAQGEAGSRESRLRVEMHMWLSPPMKWPKR